MSDVSINESPLRELHLELGGKMVAFAGWNMPVQYSSITKEHTAVREGLGIFDISHMGQFFVRGEEVENWLNRILSNNVKSLAEGEAQYSFLLNHEGGVIDDLILYKLAPNEFFMVVNAAKIDEDLDWIQGPDSAVAFKALFPEEDFPERNTIHKIQYEGETLIVCGTGYTGEDGFEFFSPVASAQSWFKKYIGLGAVPCGLGARDSLRLEVCYPLNGSDLSPDRTPLQAGLGFFCALEKDFIGCEKRRRQKSEGPSEKLSAIQYTGKGAPPRAHYSVYSNENELLGELSSGVQSPSLKIGIALAYLPISHAKIETELEIDVRGRRYPAKVVKKPFYKKP